MKIEEEVGILRQQYPYSEFAFRFVVKLKINFVTDEYMEFVSHPYTEQEFIDHWDAVSVTPTLIRAEYSLSWEDEEPWHIL